MMMTIETIETEQNLPNREPIWREPETLSRLTEGFDWLWRVLMRPSWLYLLGGVILLIWLCAYWLPQMPMQWPANSLEAENWLASVQRQYGALTSLFYLLGLFHALNSLFLRIVLVSLGFLLLLHALQRWLAIQQFQQVAQALRQPTQQAGQPLQLSPLPYLAQRQQVYPTNVEQTAAQLTETFRRGFAELETFSLLPASPPQPSLEPPSTEQSLSEDPPVNATAREDESLSPISSTPPVPSEVRLLARRHPMYLWLQLLSIVGAFFVLGSLWVINGWGWHVVFGPLTPLERIQDERRGLQLEYLIQAGQPRLLVRSPASTLDLDVLHEMRVGRQIGELTVEANTPALLIQSLSDQVSFDWPGQAVGDQVGLLFPTEGGEETVVLPKQQAGLRIVRMGDQSSTDQPTITFRIELLGNDNKTVQALSVQSDVTNTFQLDNGLTLPLRFTPVPAPTVRLTHQPGWWMLWPSLLLCLVGLYGFWRKPAFVLAQISPWPVERSLVVVQANEEGEVHAL